MGKIIRHLKVNLARTFPVSPDATGIVSAGTLQVRSRLKLTREKPIKLRANPSS